MGRGVTVVVVVPVYRNASTLEALVERLAPALAGRDWRLRLVVDASPDDSAAVARRLAGRDPRVSVTELGVNVGQHKALERGLDDEGAADAWVCLDADLQDPPEAVPLLLDRLAAGDVEAVFAGRRGTYSTPLRRWTGAAHRAVVGALTGLPADAGAFLAITPRARAAVLSARAPSLVVAIGAARLSVTSVGVQRAPRTVGGSAWTSRARLGLSLRSLAWLVSAPSAGPRAWWSSRRRTSPPRGRARRR